MALDLTTVSNIFLACIALTNVVIMAILFRLSRKK
jgi:high-affinity nickel permease